MKTIKKLGIISALILIGCIYEVAYGQENSSMDAMTPEEKIQVVDSVSQMLEDNYVFPEIGKKFSTLLHKNLKEGNYDKIDDPRAFAAKLTEDIHSVNNDRHIRVSFNPEMIKQFRTAVTPEDSMAIINQQIQYGKLNNFGFREIKFLEGNIGYLKL